MKKLSDDLYGFTDNMHKRALALETERDQAVDELKQCRALLDSYDFHQTGIHNGIMAMNNRIKKLESDLRLFKAQQSDLDPETTAE
jgi:hypothetical protein